MTIQSAWCDCCRRQVDVVGSAGLCLACYLVASIKAIVIKEADLGEVFFRSYVSDSGGAGDVFDLDLLDYR